MSESNKYTLTVSERGQITLPAALRKRLGIKSGGIITIEDLGSEVHLKPSVVVQLEMYTEKQISDWVSEDTMTEAKRNQIRRRIAK